MDENKKQAIIKTGVFVLAIVGIGYLISKSAKA